MSDYVGSSKNLKDLKDRGTSLIKNTHPKKLSKGHTHEPTVGS